LQFAGLFFERSISQLMSSVRKHTDYPGSKDVFLRFKTSARPLNQNKVFIRLRNFDCHVEKITSMLKLNPTKGWTKGDLIPNRQNAYRKQSRWELIAPVSPEDDVSKHIDFLLDAIEPKKAAFKKLINQYDGELTIVSHLTKDCCLSARLHNHAIKRIAALGLSIDFDLHFHLQENSP